MTHRNYQSLGSWQDQQMGFMSELVTLIWLIVEQSAVAQPVQTRFRSGGCRAGHGGAGDALARGSLARGSSRGRVWQPNLQICNP